MRAVPIFALVSSVSGYTKKCCTNLWFIQNGYGPSFLYDHVRLGLFRKCSSKKCCTNLCMIMYALVYSEIGRRFHVRAAARISSREASLCL